MLLVLMKYYCRPKHKKKFTSDIVKTPSQIFTEKNLSIVDDVRGKPVISCNSKQQPNAAQRSTIQPKLYDSPINQLQFSSDGRSIACVCGNTLHMFEKESEFVAESDTTYSSKNSFSFLDSFYLESIADSTYIEDDANGERKNQVVCATGKHLMRIGVSNNHSKKRRSKGLFSFEEKKI